MVINQVGNKEILSLVEVPMMASLKGSEKSEGMWL